MGKYSTLSIIAVIFAFILPPLGFVLGIAAIKEVRNTKDGNEGLAQVAVIISTLLCFWLLSLILSSY